MPYLRIVLLGFLNKDNKEHNKLFTEGGLFLLLNILIK